MTFFVQDLARLRILESGSDRWLNDKRAWCKMYVLVYSSSYANI